MEFNELLIKEDKYEDGEAKGHLLFLNSDLIGRTLIDVGLDRDISVRMVDIKTGEWIKVYDINGQSFGRNDYEEKMRCSLEQIQAMRDAQVSSIPGNIKDKGETK